MTTVFGPGNDDGATDVVLQPDGKIVVAGIGDDKIALARYTASGALDTTFGADGKVTTAVGSRSGARAVALQPDGKILVAGFTAKETNSAEFALVRYTSTGAVDPTFGSGGIVTTPFGPGFGTARALVLEPNEKIVAAGFANSEFALARYGSNGSPDASFGNNGTVTTDFGSHNGDDRAEGLVQQPDGKLVAAGWTDGGRGGGYDFALARYRSDGSLDPAFGPGGKVTTAIGPNHDLGFALVLQPDGKFVVAGMSETADVPGAGFTLVRYQRDGSLDTRFGIGGKTVTTLGGLAYALVRQPDGKLVAAGTSTRTSSADYDFALTRYNANGSVDTGFGKRGTITTPFGSDSDGVYALALQPNGRIVAVGYTSTGSNESSFALARYLGGDAMCVVPRVTGATLAQAKRTIARARCSLGTVDRAFSNVVSKGRVLSQKPRPGVKRRFGAKIDLVVSAGKKKL